MAKKTDSIPKVSKKAMAYIGVAPKLAAARQQVADAPELADYIIEKLAASADPDDVQIAKVLRASQDASSAQAAKAAAELTAKTRARLLRPSAETRKNAQLVRNTIEYEVGKLIDRDKLKKTVPGFEPKPWTGPAVSVPDAQVLPSGRPMPEMFSDTEKLPSGRPMPEALPDAPPAIPTDVKDMARGVTGTKKLRIGDPKKRLGPSLGVGAAQAAKIAGEEVVEKAAAGAAPVVGQAATAVADAATQAPKAANAGFWSGLAKMPLVGGALKALPYLGLALTAKEFLIDPVLEERKRNRTANAEALLRMRDNAEGVQYEQEQLALTQTLQKLMAQSRADEMRQVGQQMKLDFLVSPEEQKLIAQAGVPYMPSPWEYYGGGVSR